LNPVKWKPKHQAGHNLLPPLFAPEVLHPANELPEIGALALEGNPDHYVRAANWPPPPQCHSWDLQAPGLELKPNRQQAETFASAMSPQLHN